MSRKTKHRTKSTHAGARHAHVAAAAASHERTGPAPAIHARSSTSAPTRSVTEPEVEEGRQRVTGIGGVFFRCDDPDTLSHWYARHLGVGAPPIAYETANWAQEAGPTVFAPFGPDQSHCPSLGRTGWGICFRVEDLDAMVAQLRAAGICVVVDAEPEPNGRFAQLQDPEGNPVQLWQSA